MFGLPGTPSIKEFLLQAVSGKEDESVMELVQEIQRLNPERNVYTQKGVYFGKKNLCKILHEEQIKAAEKKAVQTPMPALVHSPSGSESPYTETFGDAPALQSSGTGLHSSSDQAPSSPEMMAMMSMMKSMMAEMKEMKIQQNEMQDQMSSSRLQAAHETAAQIGTMKAEMEAKSSAQVGLQAATNDVVGKGMAIRKPDPVFHPISSSRLQAAQETAAQIGTMKAEMEAKSSAQVGLQAATNDVVGKGMAISKPDPVFHPISGLPYRTPSFSLNKDPRGMGGGGYDNGGVYDGIYRDRREDDDRSGSAEAPQTGYLSKGQDFRDKFGKMATIFQNGKVANPNDFQKMSQAFNGTPFITSTGLLVLRQVKDKGMKNRFPLLQFTTISGPSSDPSFVPGPTMQAISVSPLPRSLGELNIFFDEELELLCTKGEYEDQYTPEEALVAMRQIMEFRGEFTFFFTSVLGEEGPTLGGSDSQWTDWYAVGLMLWSMWNGAMLAKDPSLLNTGFNTAATSVKIWLSAGNGAFGKPVLKLAEALKASDHQCSQSKCGSTECACEQVCFACKRLEVMSESGGGNEGPAWSFKHWEDKVLPLLSPDQQPKTKPDKDVKYEEYKKKYDRNTSSAVEHIKDSSSYAAQLTLKQSVIGPPSNLVGPIPRFIHLPEGSTTE